jgi:hypothetical protein
MVIIFVMSLTTVLITYLHRAFFNVFSRVDITEACLVTSSWLVVGALVYIESNFMLPTIPTRGHGLVLLAFATVAFIIENVAFISWFSPQWWWTVRK